MKKVTQTKSDLDLIVNTELDLCERRYAHPALIALAAKLRELHSKI